MAAPAAAPKRVFIIDDHDDVRRALAARLKAIPEIEVVGDTADAEAGMQQVKASRPDVVLLETKRADGRGLELISWIALSGLGARVFVLTSYLSEWECWAARQAGAQQYFLKDIASSQLVEQILAAATSRLTEPQANNKTGA